MSRDREGFLINFGEKVVHENPAWGDCHMDEVDASEKAVRSVDQLPEYKELGYKLCKKCIAKQTWPRG